MLGKCYGRLRRRIVCQKIKDSVGITIPRQRIRWIEPAADRDAQKLRRWLVGRSDNMMDDHAKGRQLMTDTTTQAPLRVLTEGTAGPYIIVPLDQLNEVTRLLDSRGIHYSVEENAISLDGAPYTIVINLGRAGNAAAVQSILDSVR